MPFVPNSLWDQHKTDFLSRHGFNTFLESSIRRIERKMTEAIFTAVRPIESFREMTSLKSIKEKLLICLCATNPVTCDFSPAFLYLAGVQAFVLPDGAIDALHAVRQELGWIETTALNANSGPHGPEQHK